MDSEMRDRDAMQKLAASEKADTCRRAKYSDIKPGDIVLLRQPYQNKFSTPFSTKEHQVVQRNGNSVQVSTPEGTTLKRNITHVKKVINPDSDDEDDEHSDVPDESPVQNDQVPPVGMSLRAGNKRRFPQKFKNFIMGY